MQTSITDSTTGITVTRDVDRIEILSPSSSNRQILVYFEETIKMGNKQFGPPVWLNDPLIVDLKDSRVVQALQLLKEVIEVAENTRIKDNHKISGSSSNSNSSSSSSTITSPIATLTPVVNVPITVRPLG